MRRCFDYRKLGMDYGSDGWVAFKCFMQDEEDFIDTLLDRYEEKKKYQQFLEEEGSIMAESVRNKSRVFTVRNTAAANNASD